MASSLYTSHGLSAARPEMLTDEINTQLALATSDKVGELDKPNHFFRAQFLMQELARRDQTRQAEVMVSHAATVKNCTWGIAIMTIVIMFATVFGVVHSH